VLARLYCAWAILSIAGPIAISGLDAQATTRVLVVALLALELGLGRHIVRLSEWIPLRARFVVLGTLLACVVEGFHMISKPVFASLTVARDTPVSVALERYAIDLAFTVPAYLVILAVIERLARYYRYTFWEYVFVMALGQTLGDGGIFFFASAPALLAFLPYPMTNYHALNVLPYLGIQGELSPDRSSSRRRFLAVPLLIGVYLVCGALIKWVGRSLGFEG